MIYSHIKPWSGYRMVSVPSNARRCMTYPQYCAAVMNWRRVLVRQLG